MIEKDDRRPRKFDQIDFEAFRTEDEYVNTHVEGFWHILEATEHFERMAGEFDEEGKANMEITISSPSDPTEQAKLFVPYYELMKKGLSELASDAYTKLVDMGRKKEADDVVEGVRVRYQS